MEAIEVLQELYQLVEDGLLVRNVSGDDDFPTYLKSSTRLVTVLNQVKDVLQPDRCPRCDGSGKYARFPGESKDCAICNGTGEIAEHAPDICFGCGADLFNEGPHKPDCKYSTTGGAA